MEMSHTYQTMNPNLRGDWTGVDSWGVRGKTASLKKLAVIGPKAKSHHTARWRKHHGLKGIIGMCLGWFEFGLVGYMVG